MVKHLLQNHKTRGTHAGLLALLVVLGVCTSSRAPAADMDFGSALLVGIGGAYTAAVEEAGSVWFNPAIMSLSSNRGVFEVSYRQLWELDALEEGNASVQQRIARGASAGAGFSRLGQSGLFQETRAVVALSQQLKKNWAVGTGLRYRRTEFGDGTKAYAGTSIDLGIAAHPWTNVRAGAAIRRIAIDDLYGDEANDPGVMVDISVAWSAPPDIVIAGVWSKEEGGDDRFGLGQRLRVAPGAEFLSGLRFDPVRYSLGGRLNHAGGTIDYIYQSHSDLGGTHTIGLGWRW